MVWIWLGKQEKGATLAVVGTMPNEATMGSEDCSSVLLLGLPDDVLALISARLYPGDLFALALSCRSLHAAVMGSEKVWLAQCQLLGPPPHLLPHWRRGVRSYRSLCRFLATVAPLLGIWVHQNPELGNVVCVVWGFLSVVGVRVIPQEIGPLGVDAGPLLWAPVFEILSDVNGVPSRFFLHGRDSGEDCLYPGCLHSIDSSSNVLFLEADVRLRESIFPSKPHHLRSARSFSAVSRSKTPNSAIKYRRSHTATLCCSSYAPSMAPPSSPPFSRLSFSDRRRLLDLITARIRLKVPRDLAATPLFERFPFSNDANLLADRRLELIELLKINGGWVDRKAAELALGSIGRPNAASSDHQPSAAASKRSTFSSVTGYLKHFIGKDSSANISCSISTSGNSLGSGKNKQAQLHELLGSGDIIGLSLRATHMRLTTYRAWPNMYDNRFALYKLPLQVAADGRELAGLWGGTFGWPLGQPSSEGKSGKALFFLLLSYEENEGQLLLIATKILEGTHYVHHPNGSAMFIVKMGEMAAEAEAFPWETESVQVEVKSSYLGEGIANGYGFRYPGSKPGTLFVLQNGLLAFVWKESKCVLALQKIQLQELLKKGERVPVLPPIANFAYLTKSYSNVFTGFPATNSGHSASPNYG